MFFSKNINSKGDCSIRVFYDSEQSPHVGAQNTNVKQPNYPQSLYLMKYDHMSSLFKWQGISCFKMS